MPADNSNFLDEIFDFGYSLDDRLDLIEDRLDIIEQSIECDDYDDLDGDLF